MLKKYRSFWTTKRNSKISRRTKFRDSRAWFEYASLEPRELLALVWSSAPDLPAPTADTISVLASDQNVYVLGGANTNVSYMAPGEVNWHSDGPNIDKQRVALGGGPLVGGDIFLFGGVSGGEAIEETFRYSPTNSDPQDRASMSTPRANAAYVTDPNSGFIYAFGGINADGTVLNSAEVYKPASNNWQTIASMPNGLADFSAVADGAGNIYTFGGRRQAYGVGDYVYRYNIVSDSYQAMTALPVATQNLVAVAGPNTGIAYVIGGQSASISALSTVYAYQFNTNTWAVETSLPSGIFDASATLDADGRLMVIGGRNSTGAAVKTAFVTQDLDAVDSTPIIVSSPALAATSTQLYSYQLFATGNPQPTFTLMAKPSGMTVDNHGLVSWIPTESHVGNQTVTIRATNRAGSIDQTFTIVVASSVPLIYSAAITTGGTGLAYSYDVNATGFPNPTYTLVTAPAGMTIDAPSGVISWIPTVSQFGSHAVVVKATNSHGNNQQSFAILVDDKAAPTAPANTVVSQVTLTSISLSWTAATDNVGVAKYQVVERYKYGWRGSRTGYRLFQDNILSNQTTITGLTSGKAYNLAVRAVDAAGNQSANSNLITGTTLQLPRVYGPTSLVAFAAHPLSKILYSGYGNPVPTLSLRSAPTGFTFNPIVGMAFWTPTDAQVGTHDIVVRATNSEGFSDFTTSITVYANLPIINKTFSYYGKGFSTPFGVEGDTFDLQLSDVFSNAPVNWSVVNGPTGMTIDPATGAVSWIPGAEHVGTQTALFRATNYAGSVDLPLSITVHPIGTDLRDPTAAKDLVVSVIDSNRAAITWTPATDNDAVVSYEIVAYYTYRSRGLHYVYNRYTVPADTTMFEMTYLNTRANKVYIKAFDAAGNVASSSLVSFTLAANPNFPSIGLASPLPTSALAGQNHQIQLTDGNTEPRTFALLNAPAGATIDSGTGLIDWTSSQSTLGTNKFTVRATNQFGYRDYTFSFWVFFTGPPQSVTYASLGAGTLSALATWAPPVDASHVAGYRLFQTWSIGTRSYSRTYDVAANVNSFTVFAVGGPVWHKMSVAALDEFGNVSIRSAVADFA